MSKLSTLKEQNPNMNIGVIDALSILFEKTKYVELTLNLHKQNFDKRIHKDHIKNSYTTTLVDMGFKEEFVKQLPLPTLVAVTDALDSVNDNTLMEVNRFVELNERNLIDNKDITSYKSLDEVMAAISIAELKMINKDLEKFVLKLYEDDEWLIVKPLTYESSCKYGAGTKWCTASTSEEYQYHNYTRRGILIYTMSKKTGAKVATFKNLDDDHSRETSFWNEVDDRIDSTESNLPSHVLDVIINDLRNCKKANYDLCTDDIKEINDDRFKERPSLSYSLRDLADRYNITVNPVTGEEISDEEVAVKETIGYELSDGTYTTTLA
jgi:hypothetical protein